MLAIFLCTIAFGTTTPSIYASSKSTDINGHWAQSQIENLTAQNIISGYPDGTFKPDKTITRAEFATVLVKAFKLEIKTGKVFNDTANHWAKDYIATANAFGIANGYNNDIFGPNDAISHEQMAVMIVKAAGLQSSGATLSFSDSAKVSDWAKDAVAIASAQKVITGFPDGSFQPQVEATRAQAVIVISNALQPTTVVTPVTPTPGADLSKLDKAGSYGPSTGNQAVTGDVTISASGVTLQNATISGDLLISDAVGSGEVTLNNVTVKGTTTINGGGANSIHLKDCSLGTVIADKADGNLRVVL